MAFMTRPTDRQDDIAVTVKANKFNLAVILFASLGSFTYGYSSSIIASVFGLPSFFEYFNLSLTGPKATDANQIIGGTVLPTQVLLTKDYFSNLTRT
jgi:hypothetical protein